MSGHCRIPLPSCGGDRNRLSMGRGGRCASPHRGSHAVFGSRGRAAASLGLIFHNGYTRVAGTEEGGLTFRRSDGSLREHSINVGRNPGERVSSVTTFTGQAFRPHPDTKLEPLMVLGDDVELLLPEKAWEFSERTPRIAAAGWLQGAVLRLGKGRVAVFGEAAMFSAQISGSEKRPMGMNHPDASENARFLLNVFHWLSGLLPPSGSSPTT